MPQVLRLGALVLALGAAWPAPARCASVVSARDRELLAEMRERRVLPPERDNWKPEEYAQLLRLREAEALGAIDFLRARLGMLRGFAAEHKVAGKSAGLRLTLEGYREYIFLKSQAARSYFEEKGAEAKFVFQLRDPRGRPLFDEEGMLTPQGDEVYSRAQRKLPARWMYPDGSLHGNVRPQESQERPVP